MVGVVGGAVVGGAAVVVGAVLGAGSDGLGRVAAAVELAVSTTRSDVLRSPTPAATGTARQNTVTMPANVSAGARRS